MLYTRKGDDGTTKTFGCDQRISKSSNLTEALGCMDEANSYLGICKTKAREAGFVIGGESETFEDTVHTIQKNLFIVQAELAGANKKIPPEKIKEVEEMVDRIERELPPIKSFFISGSSELGAHFDFARTLIRRAERRIIAVGEEGKVKLDENTLSYMNRLSSLLYALARLSSHKSGIKESSPDYE